MPNRGSMPAPGAQKAPDTEKPADEESAAQEDADIKVRALKLIETAKEKLMPLYASAKEKFLAWVYEGIDMQGEQQPTGMLVKVETGLKNDDYVEIISGVSEGDTVLYTGDDSKSSGSMFGGMGGMRMGGMRF